MKPNNYYGFAFDDCRKSYNKKFLKSKEGKKALKECEERKKKLQKDLEENGIDVSETWNLDFTLSHLILPRLEIFRDNLHGYPSNLKSMKEWKKILNKMIYSFKSSINDYENLESDSKKEFKKIQEGFDLFGKYYMNLWD